MRTKVRVLETDMFDGNNLLHTFTSVTNALSSGRFDYLVENGFMKRKELRSCKSVQELILLVGRPFYLVD
jgi:hypothetical protein